MKIYAYTGYIGENCFEIELFNDTDNHRIGLWSNGSDIAYTEDVYNFDLDAHPYSNINPVKLMRLCREALRRSDVGYIDELDVTSCLEQTLPREK